jgi:hypothetical protein
VGDDSPLRPPQTSPIGIGPLRGYVPGKSRS